ncbi:holo-ACP synthase [Pedobacter mucosus]|uniref:holo-ACP synthase n=1 Tax=Pedobacter mucosus TaxID=2895286 RepID=UPI001EE40ED2|nr:holo-ACP synthase [Pedobacter mucosus]UKT62884.1 holo-ACP synthase [Pedobacter mucosus]
MNNSAVKRTFSVGNDVVLLSEFEKSFNSLFKKKIYTDQEIAYCNLFDKPLLRYASTWAAKEAVYKAIKQISKSPLPFKKIEITREKVGGLPNVILHVKYTLPIEISLSITHDGDYVWAIAIVEQL